MTEPVDDPDVHQDEEDPWAPEPTEVVDPFSPGFFFADRFRIEAPLGVGAMGAVYRATDLQSEEEPIALKILLRDKQEGEARERFAREAQILSELDHPGVVGIRGYGHTKNTPWLAMELVKGETLGQRIRRSGKLEPAVLAPILRDLCDALGAAHAAGIVHRDLKPDHVLLRDVDASSASAVKLIDFGLSWAATSRKLTATGTVLGTPRYMAPEQIASARNTSARSDIYALGVIVYEALCGDSPFAASDQGQLLGAILQGRIEPLAKHRPDLPDELDAVIRRALAHRPEDRFATPRELYEAFVAATGARASQPRFSKPSLPPRATPAPAAVTPARFALYAIVALGVLLLGGAVGYLLSR
ncbi:MAG: serine/threonine protein kinase [Myxococcales bacterium]|nr:serine/threonine protein kinase [Myxococcales bacterium]